LCPKFQNKEWLLKPVAPLEVPPLLFEVVELKSRKLYICPTFCRRCKRFMDVEMPYIAPPDPHHLLEEEKLHCETSVDIIDIKLNMSERTYDLHYRMIDVSVTKVHTSPLL
ncbi:hypothetical protein PanWU01x14_069120, partial [Parasponia andersonii]